MRILIFLVLLISLNYANNLCVDLCTTCVHKSNDEMCLKTDSLCACTNILDSLNKVKQERIIEQQNLIKSLNENCESTFCTKNVLYKNNKYTGIA